MHSLLPEMIWVYPDDWLRYQIGYVKPSKDH